MSSYRCGENNRVAPKEAFLAKCLVMGLAKLTKVNTNVPDTCSIYPARKEPGCLW